MELGIFLNFDKISFFRRNEKKWEKEYVSGLEYIPYSRDNIFEVLYSHLDLLCDSNNLSSIKDFDIKFILSTDKEINSEVIRGVENKGCSYKEVDINHIISELLYYKAFKKNDNDLKLNGYNYENYNFKIVEKGNGEYVCLRGPFSLTGIPLNGEDVMTII